MLLGAAIFKQPFIALVSTQEMANGHLVGKACLMIYESYKIRLVGFCRLTMLASIANEVFWRRLDEKSIPIICQNASYLPIQDLESLFQLATFNIYRNFKYLHHLPVETAPMNNENIKISMFLENYGCSSWNLVDLERYSIFFEIWAASPAEKKCLAEASHFIDARFLLDKRFHSLRSTTVTCEGTSELVGNAQFKLYASISLKSKNEKWRERASSIPLFWHAEFSS